MAQRNKWYKWCFVPNCDSTTRKTPEKLFLSVPKDPEKRKKWFKAARREMNVSSTSVLFCCEDHFSKEEDVVNLRMYEMLNGTVNLKIREGVIPHIFDCQTDRKRAGTAKVREYVAKKKRQEAVSFALAEYSSTCDPEDGSLSQDFSDPEQINGESNTVNKNDKGVQATCCTSEKAVQVTVTSRFRSKGTYCNISRDVTSVASSPIKRISRSVGTSVAESYFSADITDLLSSHDSESDYDRDTESESTDFSGGEELLLRNKKKCWDATKVLIDNHPKMYIGVHKQWCFVFKHINLPEKNIFLTLMKIKLNDSFERLGQQFGMTASSACMIFKKTVPALSAYLESFIKWPSKENIKSNLPIAFRYYYNNVESIIDCLEIEIEKPSNPLHQSLSWSEYKGCNTIKYLVSCTPDGLINFVSNGYCGRTTDCVLLEDCGFLNKLPQSCSIMADRGFKNAARLFASHNCSLVRPPSVSQNEKLSRTQVIDTKRIASVRIHVERVIRRIREYAFLKGHAVIDLSMLKFIDQVLVLTCGLINLQNPVIRKL